MLNNLPPGVTNTTVGAPWNEEEVVFTYELHLVIGDYITIDKSQLSKQELVNNAINERKHEIFAIINHALSSKNIQILTKNDDEW